MGEGIEDRYKAVDRVKGEGRDGGDVSCREEAGLEEEEEEESGAHVREVQAAAYWLAS